MIEERTNIQHPFIEKKQLLSEIFYFSESVLQQPYRAQGIEKAFFSERERRVKKLEKYKRIVFYRVVRQISHPANSIDFRPLDIFWMKLGYRPLPGMTCEITWKEIKEQVKSLKNTSILGKIYCLNS